ncbi:MAG: tRNA (N(6)-L-threonylcarbamoyladenosine(37)-C(2))-methylthiotransferase MtaB [Hyphomicrobium sp.]|nr:tRNA (N(6)-L-threonylcarbamoyladenosine(37)-C(2))-methylthiotransferase MtaB [Hyphomicrobium sp.]
MGKQKGIRTGMVHQRMGHEPTIVTLGCRLNAVEAETIRAHARRAGIPDCIIVNTCAVTREALRQAEQTIRRLRRERPEARLVITGCGAQLEPDRFSAMPEVDAVIGNAEKLEPRTYDALRRTNDRLIDIGDIMHETRASLPPVETSFPGTAASGRSRAFVAVQTGCDHRCTFCIIPFARGPSRSVPVAEVVHHVAASVEAGYREIVLTGVDLTSYGRTLDGAPTLGTLAKAILDGVPRLPRLRLSSIDPAETDGLLEDLIASDTRLMPHLHLSLQSGDDLILKRMKRRHSASDALRLAGRLRDRRPDIAIGADVIAGFPTETHAMFERTRAVLDDLDVAYAHIFPYSARAGTPAARMPAVPGHEIKARAQVLRDDGSRRLRHHLDGKVGAIGEILTESSGRGRLPDFTEVSVVDATGVPPAGRLMRVRMMAHDGQRMTGEVVA